MIRAFRDKTGRERFSAHAGHLTLASAAAAAVALLSSQSAFAVTNTLEKVNTTATDLTLSASYTPTATPSSASDVQFQNSAYGSTSFTINSSVTFGTLNDINTSQAMTIQDNGGSAATLTLANQLGISAGAGGGKFDVLYVASGASLTIGGGSSVLTVAEAPVIGAADIDVVGALSISAPLQITTGESTTFDGGGATSIGGNISASSGSGSIIVNDGAGNVSLGGTDSYTGATVLTAGTLNLSGSLTATSGISVSASSELIESSTGVIGSGAFTQTGGTVTFAGANTYTGATTLTGGLLTLLQGASLGTTNVSVTNSTFAVKPASSGATNSMGGNLTLNSGAVFTMVDGGTSTFNVGGAGTLSPATGTSPILNFELGSNTTSDQLNFAGAATIGAAKTDIYVNLISGATPLTGSGNEFTLITAASGLASSNFVISTPHILYNGTVYQVNLDATSATATKVYLSSGNLTTPTAYWTGSLNSSWAGQNPTTFATNFTSDAAGVYNTLAVPDSTTNVYFTANSATNFSTTTLDQAFVINSLNFTGTSTSNITGATIDSGIGGTASTLTIDAGSLNGNTAGSGITVAAGSGPNTIDAPVILGASQSWTNNSGNTLTVTGAISQASTGFALTKAGTGTVSLTNASNSYSGATSIAAGTLSVSKLSNGGSPSSIGASSNLAANLLISSGGTGALQYVGSGDSTDRLFTLISSSGYTATIDSSGSGPIDFTNTGAPAFGQNHPATLVLTGTNTGNNILSPSIYDPASTGNPIAITKSGPGTWVLANADTTTGATAITGGTLAVDTTINTSVATALSGTSSVTITPAATANSTFKLISVAGSAGSIVNVLNKSAAIVTTSVAGPYYGVLDIDYTPGAYNQVASFKVNGVFQDPGLYGSANFFLADNITSLTAEQSADENFFADSGGISVPEPTSIGLIGLASLLLQRRRRRSKGGCSTV